MPPNIYTAVQYTEYSIVHLSDMIVEKCVRNGYVLADSSFARVG